MLNVFWRLLGFILKSPSLRQARAVSWIYDAALFLLPECRKLGNVDIFGWWNHRYLLDIKYITTT